MVVDPPFGQCEKQESNILEQSCVAFLCRNLLIMYVLNVGKTIQEKNTSCFYLTPPLNYLRRCVVVDHN